MFKQLRDETVPDEEEVDDQNATSVWNSTLDEAEKLDDVVERVLDETAESSDHDDTLDEYTKQGFCWRHGTSVSTFIYRIYKHR